MRITLRLLLPVIFHGFVAICLLPAQANRTISGYVRDKDSGETLIGANIVLVQDPSRGTTTNTYGFYSFSLPPGDYDLTYSYLGYQSQTVQLNLLKTPR